MAGYSFPSSLVGLIIGEDGGESQVISFGYNALDRFYHVALEARSTAF